MIIGTVLTRDGAVSVSQPGGCPSAALEGEPDAVPAVGEPGGRTKACVRALGPWRARRTWRRPPVPEPGASFVAYKAQGNFAWAREGES